MAVIDVRNSFNAAVYQWHYRTLMSVRIAWSVDFQMMVVQDVSEMQRKD